MKKVGKYLLLSLLLLLGLCCIGVLYLFFIPNSSLFNISYLSRPVEAVTLKYDVAEISQINVNSRAYDVYIVATENKTVHAELYSNSFGFVLNKNKEAVINTTLKNGIITLDVVEPHGFAVKNSSYINIYVPANYAVNLNLSNSTARTIIDDENVVINNLEYTTKSGDFKFKKGAIQGELNLNLNQSTFSIYEAVETHDNYVNLNISKGKFLAENSVLGDVYVNNTERGVVKIKECSRIDLLSNSAGGSISVATLGRADIVTSDTIINIGSLLHGATISTSTGNVTIGAIGAETDIRTSSGNIVINHSDATLTLETDSGNITVNSATLTVSVKTNYGNAYVKFNDSAESFSANPNARYLRASIYNGSLTAIGVEHVGSVSNDNGITITGNGSVHLEMNNVFNATNNEGNTINGNNGSVYIKINHSSVYTLTTVGYGSVRVNLAQIPEYYGYTTNILRETNVNCLSQSQNTLDVTSNHGSLTIVDTLVG